MTIMIDRQSMSSVIRASSEPALAPEVHDAAVRTVLRWAARSHVDVADAGLVCDALGLSLETVLQRCYGSTA